VAALNQSVAGTSRASGIRRQGKESFGKHNQCRRLWGTTLTFNCEAQVGNVIFQYGLKKE